MANWVWYPSPFSERLPRGEHAKWRCDTPPPQKGISAILARYPENKAKCVRYPLCDTISRKGIARYGGFRSVTQVRNPPEIVATTRVWFRIAAIFLAQFDFCDCDAAILLRFLRKKLATSKLWLPIASDLWLRLRGSLSFWGIFVQERGGGDAFLACRICRQNFCLKMLERQREGKIRGINWIPRFSLFLTASVVLHRRKVGVQWGLRHYFVRRTVLGSSRAPCCQRDLC